MLNLRRVDNDNDAQTIGRFSNFSAPQFRIAESMFGNLGESLEHGASPCSVDEDERDAFEQEMPAGSTSRADLHAGGSGVGTVCQGT